jgi:hypothetical protein
MAAGLPVTAKTDLHAKRYTARPTRIGPELDTKLRAIDGPAWRGDTYTIATRYEYEWQRILPAVSSSPRVRWRSTDENEHTFALYLDETLQATAESMPGNDVIAIGLFGINWRTGKLQRRDVGGGSWVDLVTLDAATGMDTLHYTRRGNTIIPATGTEGDTPYLYSNEMAGGTFAYDSGTPRHIGWHSEGAFANSTDRKLATLVLDDVAGADSGSGTAGKVWAPNMVAVVSMRGERGAAYRLVIDAQTTADGYFEIGNMVLGPVALFGHRHSWGRAVDVEHGAVVSTSPDRISRSVKYSPVARKVAFAWQDGVDLTQMLGTDPDPDYVKLEASGEVGASRHESPLLLDGLISYLDGPHRPVVYLPEIASALQTQVLTRRHQMVYGRSLDGVSIENVQGDEGTDEVVRVAAVSVEELV